MNRAGLRREASPRHVPAELHAVPEIPRTRTGKKLELPIKRILGGAAPESVLSLDAVAEPSAIDFFVGMARRRQDPMT